MIFETGGGGEEEEDELSGGSGFHGFDNEDHLCVLTTEDEHNLWTWGGNDHGQLGRGTAGVFGWRPEQVSFGEYLSEGACIAYGAL